jgi:hypothetical protein
VTRDFGRGGDNEVGTGRNHESKRGKEEEIKKEEKKRKRERNIKK